MAEAIVGSYNPETGERTESTFAYTPVQPPNPGLMTPDRANAMLQYAARTNPKAVPELYRRLEATMEYQRRQAAGDKNPLTPDVAAGLFGAGTGSAVRAFTPKPTNPLDEIRVEKAKVDLSIAKQRLDDAVKRSSMPAPSNIPTEFNPEVGKTYVTKGGALWTAKPPQSDQLSVRDSMNLLADLSDPQGKLVNTPLTNAIPALREKVLGAIQKPGLATTNAPTSMPAAPVNEVVRFTKDGRKAIFDANTKQFIRYAQ